MQKWALEKENIAKNAWIKKLEKEVVIKRGENETQNTNEMDENERIGVKENEEKDELNET
ncbi:893_t:CDS:2 [Gigaspora margarita]|uniref:893_t:CDS:1 n=1 Tax=Gigaspora margarita TaxID=4874 RepID=A0ABN7VH95_GIGMA|nr:893_t:CDS:2 [Gigaspora margarita]